MTLVIVLDHCNDSFMCIMYLYNTCVVVVVVDDVVVYGLAFFWVM